MENTTDQPAAESAPGLGSEHFVTAFPSEQHECADGTWNQTYDAGMSLRDYFAAKAILLFSVDREELQKIIGGMQPDHDLVAKTCYRLADAMMRARAQNQGLDGK